MKWKGGIRPALGVVPADQRLDAADLAAVEHHDRLVVDHELACDHSALELGLERQALGHGGPHRRLEDLEAGAAVALGVEHRHLGVAQ